MSSLKSEERRGAAESVLNVFYEKHGGLEMVIVPKISFLEWFKHMKGIVGEIDVNINNDTNWIDCPNCKSGMESYTLNNDLEELWYLCPNCNLTFSKKQYKDFTRMLMRLCNDDFKREI
jgi:hypothetical protein